MSDLATDTVLGDRFRLVAPLGDWGLGESWRARDTQSDTDVVVKLLPSLGEGQSGRFEALASRLEGVTHRGIVQTLAHGTWANRGYLVTEFVAATSLQAGFDAAIRGKTLLQPGMIANVLDRACEAISAAHGFDPPLLHGGLQPGSIVGSLTSEGLQVRVLDFGLARLFGPLLASAASSEFTAPELEDDPEAVTPACDVFAVGAIVMECTMDRRVGAPGGSSSSAYSVVSSRRDDIPPALTLAASRATNLAPARRPASVEAVREALATAWASQPVEPRASKAALATGLSTHEWLAFVDEPKVEPAVVAEVVAAPTVKTVVPSAASASSTMMYEADGHFGPAPPPRLGELASEGALVTASDRTAIMAEVSFDAVSAPRRLTDEIAATQLAVPPSEVDRTMLSDGAPSVSAYVPQRLAAPDPPYEKTVMASDAPSEPQRPPPRLARPVAQAAPRSDVPSAREAAPSAAIIAAMVAAAVLVVFVVIAIARSR